MAMEFERKLAIPAEVKEMYPLTGKMRETVETRNAKIKRIFEGKDDRLLLIIGPCSADNEESVIDYTQNNGSRIQGNAASAESQRKTGYVQGNYRNPPFTHACGGRDRFFLCR